MRLPVGPGRAGAGDRASLDHFRLRRGLRPEDAPAYAAARLAALEQAARLTADGPRWRPMGPFAVLHGWTAGSGPGSRPRVAGRVAAVAVDPGDPGHLLAGAGAGGVWESRDGGRSWRPRTDHQPTTAVGAVAFAPGDRAVAYAGTGEGEALAALGVGLLRSDDGGASWRLLPAPELLGAGFFDLLVDPGDPHRLLAATTGGLLASSAGGRGWERRLAGRSWSVSAGAGELLAGGEHGLHRSEDGGRTWRAVALASAPASFDRVAVAHSAGGQVAYVFAAGDGVGHLWRREHAGGEFEPVKPPADLRSQQAWRSWACAADPGDPEAVWLGAFGLHRGVRGRDGRWSWVDLGARPAGDSLPPAQHAVVFDPGDPRALYVANDGGLFRSGDGGRSWRSLGIGLAVAEVDQLAGHPGDEAWLLAAAGGLGTVRYEGTEVWFPATDDDLALVAGPELPGAVEARLAGAPAAGPDGPDQAGGTSGRPGMFVSEVVRDPERPGTVFAATDAGVWRSEDDRTSWRPFGRGLPNTPALALQLQRSRRTLRVGLLGRGVWELALDAGQGTAAGPVLRPGRFDAARPRPGGWWWECPDIKVEPVPGPRDEPVEPVEFEDDRGPEAAGLPEVGGRVRPGRAARVHVQVHQRGEATLQDVRVQVLAVPACLRPPDLPAGDWRPGGDPPPGSPWRPVGPPAAVGDLEPGRSAVASLDWEAPAGLPRDLTLLAVATSAGSGAGPTTYLMPADGSWGLKNLTLVGPGAGRVVRLELWGVTGQGPFALAAEGWVAERTAGLVLAGRLGVTARTAGLVPGRVEVTWRPELVTLVQEDPGLAERVDLAAAFAVPADRGTGPVHWLKGIELAPDQPEPLLLLLGEPPPAGRRGSLLLLGAGGAVLGGHTLQAAG